MDLQVGKAHGGAIRGGHLESKSKAWSNRARQPSATPAASMSLVKVRCDLVWRGHCRIRRTVFAAAALVAAVASGCGSGDSTVAKTPQATPTTAARSTAAPGPPAPTAGPTGQPSSAAADPCAVNLGSPAIARAVSELPRDPRS